LFLTERRVNVYENKGEAFHGQGRSGNVIENKYSYAFEAGMLLKTKGVDGMFGEILNYELLNYELNRLLPAAYRPLPTVYCGTKQGAPLAAKRCKITLIQLRLGRRSLRPLGGKACTEL
jgi:hypothetical protein